MTRETPILHEVRAVIAPVGPCWRNSTGVDVTRGVRYGLGVGGADLVACIRGRFCGFEVKTPDGRLTKEQQLWAHVVRAAGGFYAVVRSAEDAIAARRRAEEGADR